MFNSNMTIFANTDEEEPAETEQPETILNDEGTPVEITQEPTEETPAADPSSEPTETVDTKEPAETEQPAESEEPEKEQPTDSEETTTEESTDPEETTEEENKDETSYTIKAYCFDGVNDIQNYENIDITEKVAFFGEDGAEPAQVAPEIEGYSFDVAMINDTYAEGLRFDAYTVSNEWVSFVDIADENHTVTIRFIYHKEETDPVYITHFECRGNGVTVTADTNENAGLTEGTTLHADYMDPSSDAYKTAVEALETNLWKPDGQVAEYVLYDVYFLTADNERVEPDANVTVNMYFDENISMSDNVDLQHADVVHVTEYGGAEIVGDVTLDDLEVESAWFVSDSFSPFGPRLLGTANNATSSNLRDFLTSAKILDASGSEVTTVKEGAPITIVVSFGENPDGIQFINTGDDMVWSPLPENFTPSNDSGTIEIHGEDSDGKFDVSGNTYTFDSNGTVKFNWNTSDPNFSRLAAGLNAKFTLNVTGSFSGNSTITDKNGENLVNVTVDTTKKATAYKDGAYWGSDNKIHYTVTVTSEGMTNNISVKDIISGTALTFDEGSVTATSSTGNPVTLNPAGETVTNGFSYVIPSMTDKEKITLTYTASVDTAKLTGRGTAEQTGNSITVKPENGEGDTSTKDFNNNIGWTSVDKSAGAVSDDTTATKIIPYTIVVNKEMAASVAGSTITDSITADSQSILSYSGTGITIVVKDKDENTIRTDSIPWNSIQNQGEKSWSYTIPSDDKEKIYRYEISYTASADTSGLSTKTKLENTVTDSNGNSGKASVEVGPTSENEMQIAKTSTEVTWEKTAWKVTVTVPKNGLSKAVVTDTLPVQTYNNEPMVDLLDASTEIKVTGLLDGERYEVDKSDTSKLTVKFYKTVGETETEGLIGGTAKRDIYIEFTTINNEKWLEYAQNVSWLKEHKNTAVLSNGSQEVKAEAEVTPIKSSFNKEFDGFSTTQLSDGTTVPMLKYEIVFTGLSQNDVTITDTFDSTYFEYYLPKDTESWEADYLRGGNQYSQDHKGSSRVNVSASAGSIVFTLTKASIPMNGESYFSHYKLVYYLRVKSAEALRQLNNLAYQSDGGTVPVTNTATSILGNDSVTSNYIVDTVTKEILNNNDLNAQGIDPSTVKPHFQIVANPSAQDLDPDSNTIKLTDSYSGLSVEYDTITANPSEGVTWNASGNTITFTIPDSTRVEISYYARIVGNGNTEIKNKVSLNGQEKDSNRTVNVRSSGAGTVSIPSIKILKHKYGDMTTVLQGAKFELYKDTGSGKFEDAVQVKTRQTDTPVLFITDDKGKCTITEQTGEDGWDLLWNKKYFLKEVEAPSGYLLIDYNPEFTITDGDVADYKKYIFLDKDIIRIADKKIEVKKSLEVNKAIIGSAPEENYTFTMTPVSAKTPASEGVESVDISPIPVPKSLNASVTGAGKAVFDEIEFTQLGTYVYEIAEVIPEDKTESLSYSTDKIIATVVVSMDSEDNVTAEVSYKRISGEIETANDNTITNTYLGSLRIQKSVTVNGEITSSTLADGDYVFNVLDEKNAVVAAETITITNGVSNTIEVKNLAEGTYKVHEATDALKQGMSLTGNNDIQIEVKGGVKGEAAQLASFTNNLTTGGLKITKNVRINNETTSTTYADGIYTFDVADASGSIVATTTIEIKNGIANTAIVNGLQAGNYTVTERVNSNPSSMSLIGQNGLTAIVKAGVNGEDASAPIVNFTNNKVATGSLQITKNVTQNGNAISGSDVADGTYRFIIKDWRGEVVESNAAITITNGVSNTYTRENLPVGNYTVTEVTNDLKLGMNVSVGAEGLSATVAENATSSVAFTNNINTGSLKVQKTVTGNAGDKTADFEFVIHLEYNGVPLSGTYPTIHGTSSGTLTFGDDGNSASFKLKDNETLEVLNLPEGVRWFVTETTVADYDTEYSPQSGTITKNTVSTSTVTNNRESEGTLIIQKKLSGNAALSTDSFTVTVVFSGDDLNTIIKTLSGTSTDTTNTENKTRTIEFTIKGNETATFEYIPNGTVYTVSEGSAEGYEPSYKIVYLDPVNGDEIAVDNRTDGAGSTFNVNSSDVREQSTLHNVEITNTKNTYGDLKLTKTLTGNDIDQNQIFHFNISLTGQNVESSYTAVKTSGSGTSTTTITGTNGQFSVSFKAGEEVVVKNIANGTHYVVTEVEANTDGFITTATGESGDINGGTTAPVQTAAFTNTRNSEGALIISKQLRGNTIEGNQSFSFEVTLTDSNGTAVSGTFSEYVFDANGKHTFTIKGGETIRINGIPNNTNYSVTEASISSYENPKYVVNGREETDTASGTIKGSGEQKVQTVKIINEKNTTGSLSIEKTVRGNTTSTDSFVFTITVEGAGTKEYGLSGLSSLTNISFVDNVATLTLTGGEKAIISGLPNGAAYTVSEASYTSSGYTTVSEGESGNIDHTVIKTAKFYNTKNEFGDLVIQKSIEGNTPADSGDAFKFVVVLTKPDGYAPSTTEKYTVFKNGLQDGGEHDITFSTDNKLTIEITGVAATDSVTIRHLPAGAEYTLTEELKDEQRNKGYENPLFSENGGARSNTCTGTIKPHTEAETGVVEHVDVINTRNTFGNLKIQKTVSGNSGDTTKNFEFTVKVVGAGTKEYDFKKTTAGMTDSTTGKVQFSDDIATINLKHNEVITIKDLPNNAEYIVTEANYQEDGYETTFTGNTGTISSSASTASFNNKRDTVGKLLITKKVTGNASTTSDTYTFNVELKKPDGTSLTGTYNSKIYKGSTAPASGTVALDDAGKTSVTLNADETITIEGLPTGSTYTVSESTTGLTGYESPKYNGVVKENETGTISDSADAVVEVTNTKNLYGGFQLSKATGGNDGDKKKWFAFRIKLTGSDGNPVPDGKYGDLWFKDGLVDTSKDNMHPYKGDGVTTFEDKDYNASYPIIISKTDTVKIYGLPNGTSYEITEEPTSLTKNSYISTVTAGSSSGEIAGTVTKDKINDESSYNLSDHQITFTNIRNFYGKLQVAKKLEGNATDPSKLFNIKITLTDADNKALSGNQTYHLSKIDGPEITFTAGVATLEIKGGSSKTIYGIPKGYHFTVEEVKDDAESQKYQTTYLVEAADITDATPTDSSATGTIEEKMRKVTVTNRRDTGALKITKAVTINSEAVTASNQTRADGTYKFNIKKKDATDVLATKTISIVNGVAQSVTMGDLEPGTYVISEVVETDSLMTLVGANDQEVVVTAGKDATVPEITFTNNRDLGSLKIKKNVTVNGGTGTEADGTYMFKVEGTGFEQTVSLTINNGRSNTVNVDNLAAGNYTVSELESGSPNAVKLISQNNISVTVAVGKDAAVPTAEFTNNAVSIKFNKYNSEGNVTLSGATFELKDKNGTILDTWKTDGSVHDISEKVVRGEKYTLTETKAPEGFVKLTNPITIEIDEKGTVKIDGKAMASSDVVKLLNTKLEDKTTPSSYTSVDIKVKKVWVDGDNANGKRPSKVRVHLLANGVDTGEIAELSAANNWLFTWYALPVNNAEGNLIKYEVVEEGVDGYTSSVSGNMYNGYIITNTNKKKSPKTDDALHVFGWTVTLLASMIVSLIAALLLRRKEK